MAKPTAKQIKGLRKACKALAQYLYMYNRGIVAMGAKQVTTCVDNAVIFCCNKTMWVIMLDYDHGFLLQKYKVTGGVTYAGKCYLIPFSNACPVYKRVACVAPKSLRVKYTLTYTAN